MLSLQNAQSANIIARSTTGCTVKVTQLAQGLAGILAVLIPSVGNVSGATVHVSVKAK